MAIPDGPAIVMAILSGEVDDELTDVHAAIKRRVAESSTRVCWRISFDGIDITEENQTVVEVEAVERATTKRWGQFSPYHSAVECAAIVIAALVHRQGMTPRAAEESVGQRPAQDLMRCIDEYVLTDAPKDGTSATP